MNALPPPAWLAAASHKLKSKEGHAASPRSKVDAWRVLRCLEIDRPGFAVEIACGYDGTQLTFAHEGATLRLNLLRTGDGYYSIVRRARTVEQGRFNPKVVRECRDVVARVVPLGHPSPHIDRDTAEARLVFYGSVDPSKLTDAERADRDALRDFLRASGERGGL